MWKNIVHVYNIKTMQSAILAATEIKLEWHRAMKSL